jgi:tetratricopeptide (TPR) repeat protein
MRRRFIVKLHLLVILISVLAIGGTRADQFQLKDGRQITGKMVHADTVREEDREENRYAIEVAPGVLVRIHQSDLARTGGHMKSDDREAEYRKQIANLPETADAHYQAGQWCSQQGLKDLARAHYLRTIDLDPNHKQARAAVEHTLDGETGRWVKRGDLMLQRGKVYHQGRWQFPEYIPMDEQVEEEKKQKAALQKEISRLHNEALRGTPDRVFQAVEQLRQINDPLAIEYLSQLLLGRQRGGTVSATPQLKLVYIDVLSNFELPVAFVAIAHASVLDADNSVRTAALEVLARRGREVGISVISGYLKSPNNQLINSAAFALGRLNAQEMTLPLIDALVTRHEVQPSEATTYTPGGLVMGSKKKQLVNVENDSVRSALSQITGQGRLGFDQAAWRAWYASVYAPPVDDLRRDP